MSIHAMGKNYIRAFRFMIITAVILAVVTAVAIPLSLRTQISEAAVIKSSGNYHSTDGDDRDHEQQEEELHSMLTPLNAINYCIIGVLGTLWTILVVYYWVTVAQWLYKNSLQAGMNKSLWTILGAFFNFLAVLAFLIVRDQPSRKSI